MNKIIKRDGRLVDFDAEKIKNAILKAFVSVDKEISDYALKKAENIAIYIESEAKERSLSITDIQTLVENGLMSTKRRDVARAYITYRHDRDAERTKNSDLRKRVKNKLTASQVQNQNANVDEHSFGGRMGEASAEQLRDIALNEIVSPMAKENHLENMIYIHDLDSYAVGMHNCLTIPFDKLLAEGFNTRQTDVRPANSINTAFQLVAVIFQLQSLQQFGGVSASHLDWTMVPYIRKSFIKHWKNGIKYIELTQDTLMSIGEDEAYCDLDRDFSNVSIEDDEFKKWNLAYKYAMDMTIKECQQAVEGMFHNLNTLQSRSGNQLKWMAG